MVGRILDLPMASPDSSLYQEGHVIIMRGRNLNEIDRIEEE